MARGRGLRLPRILLVGIPGDHSVGGHLEAAAKHLGADVQLLDVQRAYGKGIVQKVLWRIADGRPYFFRRFGDELLEECDRFRPDLLLVTGLCPVDADVLTEIGRRGVRRATFLTDDPFNPLYKRKWLLRQLAAYDCVFTPRRSNEAELKLAGAKRVERLMFGYNPIQHKPSNEPTDESLAADIMFLGGADGDRVPILSCLIQAGFHLALYGAYWERYRETRAFTHGIVVSMEKLRRATAAAKLTVILVRRANRDGHVMRTFEAAACRACLLVEDTAEHREIFGPDGECVRYFDGERELVAGARSLLGDPSERSRLADASHHRIAVLGKNTYGDRLGEAIRLCMGTDVGNAFHSGNLDAGGKQ